MSEQTRKLRSTLTTSGQSIGTRVMHPNENMTSDQAFSLLGIGYSAITQVMQAIETQPHAEKALGGMQLIEVPLEHEV
jgi:hypothetical protein